MNESVYDLILYWFIYALLGWVVEAGYFAVTRKGFYNGGLLSMPLSAPAGFTMLLMLVGLPALQGHYVLQLIFTVVLAAVVDTVSRWLTARLSDQARFETQPRLHGDKHGLLTALVMGGGFYLTYLLIHPWILLLVGLLPPLAQRIVTWALLGTALVDFILAVFAVRRGDGERSARRRRSKLAALGAGISNLIWRRLRRAYPGIERAEPDGAKPLVFAKGLCKDKLLWIFFTACLVGDLTEMVYCRLVGGSWVSRSSLLYGPFSLVWGFGGVLLTLTLHRLADKADRYVFLGGFFIGGVYEYMCSVFTELVFGTVFWDYSWMPLNIGGRTNVLFCFFWGLAALIWIKLIYPKLSGAIERIPVLLGKVLTWILVLLMACDMALTGMAMLRYQTRLTRPEPANRLEVFLDRQYDDAFMEHRWADMDRVEK